MNNMDQILSAASKASREQLSEYNHTQKEIELVGEEKLEAEEVGWGAKKTPGYIKKKVSEWGNREIVAYCFAQHRSFTGKSWHISYMGAQEGVKLTQEVLKRFFGEWPSYRVTKYYIDWFFREQAEYLIGNYGIITFKMMRHENSVKKFVEFCQDQNIELKTKDKHKAVDNSCSNISMDEDKMKKIMDKGITPFLNTYGLFICYHWLKNKDNHDKEMLINKISKSVLGIIDNNRIDDLFALTEKLGPYPFSMKKEFSDLLETLARLTGEPFTLISVEYINEPKK